MLLMLYVYLTTNDLLSFVKMKRKWPTWW